MKMPKGYYAIEFGHLLPGDEFVNPEDVNKVLVKRRSGGRICHAEPTGIFGDEKIVYAKKGDRQDRVKGIEETLARVAEQVKTLQGEIGKLRGVDEPEKPVDDAA